MQNSNRSKLSAAVIAILPFLIFSQGVPAVAQASSEWSAPVNLGRSLNTPGFDGCPSITDDGLTLIFMSNYGSSAQELHVSQRVTRDSPWGPAASVGPDINTAAFSEVCPVLSSNGQYLYFVSDRPGGCGGFDIYVSRRVSERYFTQWSEPQNLGCQVNSTGRELSPSLFEDEDGTAYLYFSSGLRPGGLGFGDIYVARGQVGGTFDPPTPVSEFNTTFNEIRPKIRARDGLEIFFDSNRPGSIGGTPDLYSSTRACAFCPWSVPVNFGSAVNSAAIDGGPSLSLDGTELYFMSNRPGGWGDQDLYVITRKVPFR